MKPVLHPQTLSVIDSIVAGPAGTYLFHGPANHGKATTAIHIARLLNCRDSVGDRCGSCLLFESGNHPSLTVVAPIDRPSISVEQVRRLHQDLSLQSYSASGQRVVIIDGADVLTIEAQNALLKVIEEPPSRTVMILISTDIEKLLPTVRSRCQAVYFPSLSSEIVTSHLQQLQEIKPSEAAEIAALAQGAIGLANTLATDSEEINTYRKLDKLSQELLEASLFERLVAARQLVDSKAPIQVLVRRMQQHLINLLRKGDHSDEAIDRLEAIALYWRHIESNVSPRVALEGLLLKV